MSARTYADATYTRLRDQVCTEPGCERTCAWYERSELCAPHLREARGLPPAKGGPGCRERLVKIAELAITVYGARPPDALMVAAELVDRTPAGLERALYRAGAHDLVHRLKGIGSPIPNLRRERITTP